MTSTGGGQSGQTSKEEPPGRQKPPDKQELVSMLAVRGQVLKAAEPKAAIGNLDNVDTPEVIRVEAAFALRKFPELREELDAQQALLKRLLEMDCAARQSKQLVLDSVEMADRKLRTALRRFAERLQAVEPLENVASEQSERHRTLEDLPEPETDPSEEGLHWDELGEPPANVARQPPERPMPYRELRDIARARVLSLESVIWGGGGGGPTKR
ncbi:hypothetical protein B5807_08559 [Epicoccum nigrum]|uniref:Uncharacterized protein n=1 Tax=Epicoccum nigrum TaxID=105696 RepID=A0A1Y2LRP5_EPING|nr:hypothetical protein B5807_08559 [Epicoccum nigrum]